MIIKESVHINTSIKKVWNTFADLTRWMHWNTVIRDVNSDEKHLTRGKDIQCCFRPFLFPIKVRIRIEEIRPYDRIVWSARKKGLFALHEFFFEGSEKGVLVTSKETFTGLLVSTAGFLLPLQRMKSLTKTFLKDLKKASEDH
jgi:hypothetical protein